MIITNNLLRSQILKVLLIQHIHKGSPPNSVLCRCSLLPSDHQAMFQEVFQVGKSLLQVWGGQAMLISQLQEKRAHTILLTLKQPTTMC